MKLAMNRSWLILILALGLGVLAAFGVNRYITRQVEDIENRGRSAKTVKVLVPKSDLSKGSVLSAKSVAVREVPAEWAHTHAMLPAQFDRVENQKLAYPAAAGEMLMWSMLEGQRAPSFSSRLPAGRRAITVPVDDVNSISGMLEPGDRIDLMVSVKKDARTMLFPLLQNVVVLATGTRAAMEGEAKEGGKRTYTTITLDASPAEAQQVLAAREVGKLAALLRAPGDTAAGFGNRKDALSLLGFSDKAEVADGGGVPVLYGGQGGMKGSSKANDLPGSKARPAAATAALMDAVSQ
ncbi:MAG: Flp pilus assembly protein CpaB [Pseudorhodobacter sp.]|nr:Flp pilus assembly protein CpaB [Rhizobacter sp.]